MSAFSHQNNNHQKQLKILFNLHLRCQAIQNAIKFHVYVTDNVEIVLQIHSGKNTDIDETLNKSGKELL